MSYVGAWPWWPIQCFNKEERRRKKIDRLRGERDQIKFIDLGFERWEVIRFRKARGRQDDDDDEE